MRFFIIIIVTVLNSLIVSASDNNVVKVNKINDLLLAGSHMHVLEDNNGTLSLNDVLLPENQVKFKLYQKDVFSRPATRSVFWFKLNVQNFCNEDVWLEIGSTYAWYIDFYSNTDSTGKISVIKTGTMRSDSSKLYNVNLFWLPLNKANDTTIKTYYVRIQSGLTYELPFHVGTLRSLHSNKAIFDYLTAGFLGVLLIMFLYNAFVYFSIRDKIYLYYLGYLLLMVVSMPYANNYPFIQNLHIFFIDKAWWNTNFLFWHPPVYFFIGVFCIKYLNLSNNSKWLRRIIIGEVALLSGVFPLLTIMGISFIDLVNFIQPLILLFYLTCLYSGYYLLFKKVSQAIYYILGWTFMVIGVFVFFAVINGIIPYSPIVRNALYFGTAIEVWLFSLALGNRLNILQREKEQIQLENIRIINQQNVILENKVLERTNELQEKNFKLGASNEELKIATKKLNDQSKKLKELNTSKDRIFAVISHDLRSPLVSLLHLIELTEIQLKSHEKYDPHIGKLKKDVEQLHFALNNLLQWALTQMIGITSNKQLVNIRQLAEENIVLMAEFARNKKVEIVNAIDDQISGFVDPDQIRVVFRNLLNNAIKFSYSGSKVYLLSIQSECFFEIAVKDSGVGMNDKLLNKLFDIKVFESKFGTEGEKGTGLGLILSRDFIEKNGGSLRVESKEGEGTTFFISIPVTEVPVSSY